MIQTYLKTIAVGLQIAFVSVIIAFSSTMLIFNQELQPYFSFGIGTVLISIIVLNLILPFFSKIPGIIALPQPIISASIAMMALPIAQTLAHHQLNDQILPTTIALIILSTLIIGITFLILGYFRLGRLLQIIPYPVICGVLGGLGWLIVLRGISVLIGIPIKWKTLPQMMQWAILPQLILGIAISVAYNTFFLFIMGRKTHFLRRLAIVLGILVPFFISYKLITLPASFNWFMTSAPGHLWPAIHFSDLELINWSLLLDHTSNFAIMIFACVISFVFYTNSLEVHFQKNLDLDTELRAEGIGNAATALFGGIAGYQMLNLTIQVARMKINTQLMGAATALFAFGLLFADASNLNYIPKALLGGIIVSNGLIFIDLFVFKTRPTLPLLDFLLVLLIIFIIGIFGFPTGVIVGIIAAATIFIGNISKESIIKYALSGTSYHSHVQRTAEIQKTLMEEGKRIYIIKLQGTLFFGTAYGLFKTIEEHVEAQKQIPIQFLILDFQHVSSLDSSARFSFVKLNKAAQTKKITIIITNISSEIRELLELKQYQKDSELDFKFFTTLDYAMEWCEEQILEEKNIPAPKEVFPYSFNEILPFFDKVRYEPNEVVVRQGDHSDQIYFIESGKVTVYLQLPDERRVRLSTLTAGTFIGELGFYLGTPRTSSVITDQPTTLYAITRRELETLQIKYPQLVSSFHETVARTLAQRLVDDNKIIEVLSS